MMHSDFFRNLAFCKIPCISHGEFPYFVVLVILMWGKTSAVNTKTNLTKIIKIFKKLNLQNNTSLILLTITFNPT